MADFGITNERGDFLVRAYVELMLELTGHQRDLGIDSLLSRDRGFGALLQEYQPDGEPEPEKETEEQRRLDNALRAIAEIPHTVTATPHGHDYAVAVTTTKRYRFDPAWTCELLPLTLTNEDRLWQPPEAAEFTGLTATQVTPFVCVRLTSGRLTAGTVVLAELEGDPPDRVDQVIASQLNTPEKFMRFLLLVLSLGNPHLLAQLQRAGGAGAGGVLAELGSGPGILELVLRALATHPDSLDDLAEVVSRLRDRVDAHGEPILPEGFDELWDAVEQARAQLQRSGGGERA